MEPFSLPRRGVGRARRPGALQSRAVGLSSVARSVAQAHGGALELRDGLSDGSINRGADLVERIDIGAVPPGD